MSISANMRQIDIRPNSAEINYKGFRFLITDRPSDQTIHNYVQVSSKLSIFFPVGLIDNRTIFEELYFHFNFNIIIREKYKTSFGVNK